MAKQLFTSKYNDISGISQKGRTSWCGNFRLPVFTSRCLLVFIFLVSFFEVKGQLAASFTVSDTAGCVPFIVHFTNTSTGATSYAWNLGNGTTSSLTNVSGSYLSAGTYTVTLTAYNGPSSQTYTMVIRAYSPPTVNFFGSTTAICPGTPITFTSATVANSWGPLSYIWNFGDGFTSTATSPVYSYAFPGAYNVTLFATNGAGCINSFSRSGYIYVYTPALVGFKAANTAFCKAPASVSFTNTTTGTGPYSYTWFFGDGSSSFSANPVHIYTVSGSYSVTLKVTDANGCTDSLVQPAFINIGSLAAGFTRVSGACLFTPVTFKNSSTAYVSSKWDFGDGSTSTDTNGVHSYFTTGIYPVKLVVSDGTCYDSVTHYITIAKPTGSFTISPGCQPPVPVTFHASIPAGATADWTSYLHGPLGRGATVVYTYPNTGPYNYGGVIDEISMVITDVNGCKDTLPGKIDSINSLFVNIAPAPADKGCTPLTVHFSAYLTALDYTPFGYFPPNNLVGFPYPYGIASYIWDFADGSPTSTSATPVHIFTTPGLYPVSCTVVTTNGCTAVGIDTIRTGIPAPTAGFTRSPSRVCAGQPVRFISTSTGTINEYSWTFGDGGSITVTSNPVHVYSVPGIYNADLVVYNNGCASAHYSLKDTVDSPGANISYKYACIPDNGIVFADSSYGDNAHLWQFGDGTTSTAANPLHYYTALSNYTAMLTTYNIASGCRDTAIANIHLQRLSTVLNPNENKICRDNGDSIGAAITNVMYGIELITSAAQCAWYINGVLTDIDVPYFPNPLIPSKMADTVYHVLRKKGNDTVTLILTDNHGCLDTVSTTIVVAKPIDNFSFTPSAGCAPMAVNFTDLSSDVPGAFLSRYYWSFGDGSSIISGTPSIVHIYTSTGVYTINEIVTDNIGCSDTLTGSSFVTVDKPTADFSASTTFTCVGLDVSFNNTSTGAVRSFWMFGDGATSTVAMPDHIYYSPGIYTVTLVVFDAKGCPDTMTQTNFITVNPLPSASFLMSDSFAVCPPLNVNFTNTSTGATSSHWTFGDGTYSVINSPNDIYISVGLYRIKLVAVNAAGCTDSAIGHASIFGYAGAFSYTPLTVCMPLSVHFTAPPSGAASVVWDFSDGVVSGGSLLDTISHIYKTVGSYVPKLFLTDVSGCTSFSLGADTIKADTIIPAFTIISNPSCQYSNITFADSSYSYSSSGKAWAWTFGFGATSTARIPIYAYSVAGTHPVTLSVTNGSGCKASITKNVTINPAPAPITGSDNICIGQPATLSDATSGGVWSSSNTAIATVAPGTGFVTGISPGAVNIAYSLLSTACKATMNATVGNMPSAITGATGLCTGLTTQLSNATTGGLWSSSNTSVATVGPGTGIVNGKASGTATITYQLSTGCAATVTVKVDSSPAAISGPSTICLGTTITLSNAISGGSWFSGNTTIATINIITGDVTGKTLGPVTITYTLGSGCTSLKTVTVIPLPPVISGNDNVCKGLIIILSESSGGGKWSSSNTAIAAIDPFGLVLGSGPGAATISYTNSAGCAVTKAVTVNPMPSVISGVTTVCKGATITLSDIDTGGNWKSSGGTIASINPVTGLVAGVSAGTVTITYTLGPGCKITTIMTVKPSPLPIAGISNVCAGSTVILSDATVSGTWSSNNTAIASVGTGAGVVLGIAAGTATISYIPGNGCMATTVITVDSLPSPITGFLQLCKGLTTTMIDSGGGTWNAGNPSIASIGSATGIVNGLSPGTSAITYTLATGCITTMTLTVIPLPSVITGNATVCVGDITALTDIDGGGLWSVDSALIATVSSGKGIVTGISGGTATITYTLPTGCIATKVETVNPVPAAITGNTNICVSVPAKFIDTTNPGVWSSADATVAVGTGTGVVTGVSPGTATISFTLVTGCIATKQVSVAPLPAAITGNKNICLGLTTTLCDIAIGGVWSSVDTSVIVAPGTGVISGVKSGTATITYMLATGCYATTTATVNPEPTPIAGIKHVCAGKATVLSDSIGTPGNWTSSSASIALVNSAGIVTGVSGGTATITYTTNAGCIALTTVTVYPVITPINGKTTVCKGGTITLLNAIAGGTWVSSNSAVANINASGVVAGITTGSVTISYMAVNTCDTAYAKVVVNPLPDAGSIKGNSKICTGSTELLSDAVTGGLWTSSNNNIAGINSSGLITGISEGTTTIVYTYTNSCGTAKTEIAVTVNPTPARAHITTHPDMQLCTNSLFRNFGADTGEPPGSHYIWSAENAVVYAVSRNRQYCLINFNSPGTIMVILSSEALVTDCSSNDTLVFNIGPRESPNPVVVYYAPEFVCKDNTAGSYQWGYDDAVTLDSTLLPGMINQNYYNQNPDFLNKYYWVMTYYNGCLQKSYYNAPTGIAGFTEHNPEILLFPNPAGSEINIEVKGKNRQGGIDAAMYDILGKERTAATITDGAGRIKLSGLPPGVYLIMFSRDGVRIGSRVFVKE